MSSSLAAHADTLTYNVTTSFSDGGSVDGSITLDNATGLFTAANLVAKGFPISNETYSVIADQEPDIARGYDLDVVPPGYGPELEFDFSPTDSRLWAHIELKDEFRPWDDALCLLYASQEGC